MVKQSLVSVVVVTRNRNEELQICLASIFKQSYRPLEVIVVDNGSERDVKKAFLRKFPKVKFVRSEVNLGGAGGRNLGLLSAKANMILFMDDDAFADGEMIKELVKVLRKNKKNGIVQPKIYEAERKDMLQGVGHGINLKTGRVYGIGVHVKDIGQFEKVIPIPMAGCTWMVRREVFERIGNYDEEIFIPYEDSDFSQRARDAGFEILYIPKAMVWHKGPKKTFVHPFLEWLGITTPERSFRVVRNKTIFMKKHAKKEDFLVFLFFYLPIYTLLHSFIILVTRRFDILLSYWKGLVSGLKYVVRDFVDKVAVKLDASIDPVCRIIDRSTESILDVGCGQGYPMVLLKQMMKPKYTVGVDLFEEYIRQAKAKNIHDKYVVSDIRKIKFRPKSFDVVLASHVIEHLLEKDAYKLIKKLERIAKKQVIIATPIGEMYHPAVDHNELQLHLSHFYPEDFEKLGYKTIKYGRKAVLGETGFVHKIKFDPLKKFVFLLNIILAPFYYYYPSLADYIFVAYKDMREHGSTKNK